MRFDTLSLEQCAHLDNIIEDSYEKADGFNLDEQVDPSVKFGMRLSIAVFNFEVLNKKDFAIEVAEKTIKEYEEK